MITKLTFSKITFDCVYTRRQEKQNGYRLSGEEGHSFFFIKILSENGNNYNKHISIGLHFFFTCEDNKLYKKAVKTHILEEHLFYLNIPCQ